MILSGNTRLVKNKKAKGLNYNNECYNMHLCTAFNYLLNLYLWNLLIHIFLFFFLLLLLLLLSFRIKFFCSSSFISFIGIPRIQSISIFFFCFVSSNSNPKKKKYLLCSIIFSPIQQNNLWTHRIIDIAVLFRAFFFQFILYQ